MYHIFCELKQRGYQGDPIHEIYVDEVQDFTQAELRLFLEVCVDKNALFLTGDTCQTIARGVGFRFEELTTMFARLLQQQQQEETEKLRESERVKVPHLEKLTINYRTHNGILGCAARVVDILLDLFPNAVDKLEKDRGHFNGPKPQLLTETTTDHLAVLLLGSDRTQSQIEFGAHQAVLVRSQAAKETLPEEFDGALVLTIFESKGLEFDDVFIYNFFADSPADEKTWRVLTGWWEDHRKDMHVADLALPPPRPTSFCRERHGILEEELKQLYTAVTRARVRVAMYDASTDKRQPAFSFLHAEGLAEIEAVDVLQAADRKGWAVAAGKDEWQSRGACDDMPSPNSHPFVQTEREGYAFDSCGLQQPISSTISCTSLQCGALRKQTTVRACSWHWATSCTRKAQKSSRARNSRRGCYAPPPPLMAPVIVQRQVRALERLPSIGSPPSRGSLLAWSRRPLKCLPRVQRCAHKQSPANPMMAR